MSFLAFLRPVLFFLVQAVFSEPQCNFPTQFQSSVWVDSDKGELVFTTANMTGWEFNDPGLSNEIIEDWECFHTDTVDSKLYLLLRSTRNITFSDIFTAYLCMELTEVTPNLYYYYLLWGEQPNYENERITTFQSTFSISNPFQVCLDSTIPAHAAVYPDTGEYHVLVKKGNELDAKQECPSTFFGKYSYTVTDIANGADSCGTGDEDWDVCTDYTRMTFNYSACNTQISYSANGSVFCLVSIESGSYVYHTVYNEDNTVDVSSGTYRFTCFTSVISSDGSLNVSQTPGSCKKGQIPNDQPVFASNNSAAGLNIKLTPIVLCPKTTEEEVSGLSTGAIVGIVFGVLILAAAVILIVLFFMKMKCRNPKTNKAEEDKTPVTSPRSNKLSVDIDDFPHQSSPQLNHGRHSTAPMETRFDGDHKISKSPTLDHKYNPFSALPLAKSKSKKGEGKEILRGVSRSPGCIPVIGKTDTALRRLEKEMDKPLVNSSEKKNTRTESKSIQTDVLLIEDLDKNETLDNKALSSKNIYHKPVEKRENSPPSKEIEGFYSPKLEQNGSVSRTSNLTPKAIILETNGFKSNTLDIHNLRKQSPGILKETKHNKMALFNEINDRKEIEPCDKEVSALFSSSDKRGDQNSMVLNDIRETPKTPISVLGNSRNSVTPLMKTLPPSETRLQNTPDIIKTHFKSDDFKNTASFFQIQKPLSQGKDNEKNSKGKKKPKVATKLQKNTLVKETPKKPKKSAKSANTKSKSNKRGHQAFTSLVQSKSTSLRNKKGTFYNEDIPTVAETESYLTISESRNTDRGICYDDDNERARALGYWSNNVTQELDDSQYVNRIDDTQEGNPKELKLALGTLEDRSASRTTFSTDISARGSVTTRSLSAITSRIDSRGARYFIENEASSIAIHVKASDVPDDLGVIQTVNEESEDAELDHSDEDDAEDEDEDGDDIDEEEGSKDKDDVQTSMSVLYGQINEGGDEEERDPDRMILDGYVPDLLTIKE